MSYYIACDFFKRDSKESIDVPTPGLIGYMFIYFEFERAKMFCCWLAGKNGDRKRVPKVSDTVRERVRQVQYCSTSLESCQGEILYDSLSYVHVMACLCAVICSLPLTLEHSATALQQLPSSTF